MTTKKFRTDSFRTFHFVFNYLNLVVTDATGWVLRACTLSAKRRSFISHHFFQLLAPCHLWLSTGFDTFYWGRWYLFLKVHTHTRKKKRKKHNYFFFKSGMSHIQSINALFFFSALISTILNVRLVSIKMNYKWNM